MFLSCIWFEIRLLLQLLVSSFVAGVVSLSSCTELIPWWTKIPSWLIGLVQICNDRLTSGLRSHVPQIALPHAVSQSRLSLIVNFKFLEWLRLINTHFAKFNPFFTVALGRHVHLTLAFDLFLSLILEVVIVHNNIRECLFLDFQLYLIVLIVIRLLGHSVLVISVKVIHRLRICDLISITFGVFEVLKDSILLLFVIETLRILAILVLVFETWRFKIVGVAACFVISEVAWEAAFGLGDWGLISLGRSYVTHLHWRRGDASLVCLTWKKLLLIAGVVDLAGRSRLLK